MNFNNEQFTEVMQQANEQFRSIKSEIAERNKRQEKSIGRVTNG